MEQATQRQNQTSREGRAVRHSLGLRSRTVLLAVEASDHQDRMAVDGSQLAEQVLPYDMGRYSYSVGAQGAMAETWGSTCHGAGRLHSRHEAKRMLASVNIRAQLAERGIYVRAQNPRLLSEEASEAHKDVAQIIEVLDGAGIAMKVCRNEAVERY
jgi:RNA-splicing ligase RtcB